MNKKIPMRQCMGCHEMKPKRELVRIVRSPDNEISIDLTGRKNGRGAYICKNPECLKKAIKSKALSRAFGVEVPDDIYESLSVQLEGN